MKSYILPAFVFPWFLLLASCGLKYKEDKKDEKVDLERISGNDYSIGIPTYMTKTTSLNGEASLQFQNMFKETYVIVIDESKKDFIDVFRGQATYDTTISVVANYANVQIQSITSRLKVVSSKKKVKMIKINGLNAATVQIEGKAEGVEVPIAYFLTYIESEQKLYMIMAWTLQDRKKTYGPTFNQIARSFRRI